MLGQTSPGTTALLDLGAFILEPDLDLGLVEAQFSGEVLASLLGEVAVLVELFLESPQLVGCERRPWSLLVGRSVGSFDSA